MTPRITLPLLLAMCVAPHLAWSYGGQSHQYNSKWKVRSSVVTPPVVVPPVVVPPVVVTPPVVKPPVVVTPPTTTSGWWKPKGQYSWQIQFTGTIDPSMDAQVNFMDLVGTDATRIAQVHAKGQKAVCYFSAGAVDTSRAESSAYPAAVKGTEQASWPGVYWLDVRRTDILIPIMGAHIASAKQKGCDGVMIDNADVHTQQSGFPISANDNLNYLRALATEAHRQGVAIGMNNNLLQIPALINDMDFGINESCMVYNECGLESPFITAGKPVFHLEYTADITSICNMGKSYGFSSMKKNRLLDAWRQGC